MAYITQFSVSGLAGRANDNEYAHKLDRHVNVFFGLNGSGKTSLLKILDSAMSNDASTLVHVPFQRAEVHIFTETYKAVFVRTLNKEDLLEALVPPSVADAAKQRIRGQPAASYTWNTEPRSEERPSRWRHVFLTISRMYPVIPYSRIPDAPAAADNFFNESFQENVKGLWRLYMTAVLTDVSKAQSAGLTNILADVLLTGESEKATNSIDEDVAYKKLSTFLARQDASQLLPKRVTFKRRYEESSQLRKVVRDIDEVENRIAAAMSPRTQLQGLIERMFSGKKSIVFGDNDIRVLSENEETFPLGLLSSGEKQILRILIETLRIEESALLIDEPELSMHIDWQRELVGAMRKLNPRAQFILATHSPEIMAEIDDDLIYKL